MAESWRWVGGMGEECIIAGSGEALIVKISGPDTLRSSRCYVMYLCVREIALFSDV